MYAADTCSIVAYLNKDAGIDVTLIEEAMRKNLLAIPPTVQTELLSSPKATTQLLNDISAIPLLEIVDGYWQRSGQLRRVLLQQKRKCKLGDTLVAQSCIDHDVPLITRDTDFLLFVKHGGLKLAMEI